MGSYNARLGLLSWSSSAFQGVTGVAGVGGISAIFFFLSPANSGSLTLPGVVSGLRRAGVDLRGVAVTPTGPGVLVLGRTCTLDPLLGAWQAGVRHVSAS